MLLTVRLIGDFAMKMVVSSSKIYVGGVGVSKVSVYQRCRCIKGVGVSISSVDHRLLLTKGFCRSKVPVYLKC